MKGWRNSAIHRYDNDASSYTCIVSQCTLEYGHGNYFDTNSLLELTVTGVSILQKQIGRFNQRVVALVADQLERWCFFAQGNLRGGRPVHLATTIHSQPSEHL